MARKRYGLHSEAEPVEDHWKSFVDIFATICLTFFFIMIVFMMVSNIQRQHFIQLEDEHLANLDEFTALWADYESAQADLDDQADMIAAQEGELSEKEAQYQAALAMLQAQQAEYDTNILRMNEAQRSFEEIFERRLLLYEEMEVSIKEVLGEDSVYLDRAAGKFYINSEVLFDSGDSTITPEYMATVQVIKDVLFEMIDLHGKDKNTDAPAETNAYDLKIDFFEIRGHTDNAGGGIMNRDLSVRRAAAFIDSMLPENSPEEARYGAYFLASGISKFAPVAGSVNTQTTEEQAANRRVELIIRFDDNDIAAATAEIAQSLDNQAPASGGEVNP